MCTGAILIDLKSFFDTIRQEDLITLAKSLELNGKLLRLAVDGYRVPWFITRDGLVAEELHPTRGVAAGCGLATTIVKVICIRASDKL